MLVATDAGAQIPLADVIPTMLGPQMTIAPGPGGTHAQDFALAPGDEDIVLTDGSFGQLVDAPRGSSFSGAVAEQLTRFPIGSSSGGFLYEFDPVVGTFTRVTRTFGSSYGERPWTSGRGTLSVGLSVQSIDYDRFADTPLDGGDLRFYFVHRDVRRNGYGQPFLDRSLTPENSDVMEAALRLRIHSRTVATTVTYGLANRVDIGVVIPMVETTLNVQLDKRILRLGTASDPTIHSFDGLGSDTATATGGGTASGLGDVRVQVKYNVVRYEFLSVAAVGDVRLPTGDSDNLLGRGRLFTRMAGIVSTGTRVFSPRATVGVVLGRSEDTGQGTFLDDEINYTFGADWSVVPRATLSADLLVRTQHSTGTFLSFVDRELRSVRSAGGPVVTQTVRESVFTAAPDSQLMQMALGGKVNPWRTFLVTGNVLLPVFSHALRNKPAISFGVEYTF